jgi:uncharacterized coiled-coil protein SlyX
MHSLTLILPSSSVQNSTGPATAKRALVLIALALACSTLSPTVRAADGGLPDFNTAEGTNALASLADGGMNNTAIGASALGNNTVGSSNTASGSSALASNTTGNNNTATGVSALQNNNASNNTANGTNALFSNTTGSQNTAIGYGSLQSNNADANTAIGYQALLNNTTGANNTANGFAALESNSTGQANTAAGVGALENNTAGNSNTATGIDALARNTTGAANTATGAAALVNSTTGLLNTAEGFQALQRNTTGSSNIAMGANAGISLTTGSNNVLLGANAGLNLNTGSNNIDIGNQGVTGEAAKIRIGKQGTQTGTYIAGIYGKTVASGTKVAVMIDSTGKLGTVVSSARFKEAIQPMDKGSEALLALKPVTFRYKHELDPDGIPQFGLIAEQVEKVNPDLVVRGEDGKVMTVRYEAVNAMLLNEFLKEHRKVQELEMKAGQQQKHFESALAKQETTIEKQQNQIEALTATVQKVSDQIALSKPAPQLVATLK